MTYFLEQVGYLQDLGLVGMEISAAVEIDKDAASTYTRNFGDIVFNKDIADVTGEELLVKVNLQEDDLLVLAGCPPCQGFSGIGLRNAEDIRNKLVNQYIRLISEISPEFIVMENVQVWQKAWDRRYLEVFVAHLKKTIVFLMTY